MNLEKACGFIRKLNLVTWEVTKSWESFFINPIYQLINLPAYQFTSLSIYQLPDETKEFLVYTIGMSGVYESYGFVEQRQHQPDMSKPSEMWKTIGDHIYRIRLVVQERKVEDWGGSWGDNRWNTIGGLTHRLHLTLQEPADTATAMRAASFKEIKF